MVQFLGKPQPLEGFKQGVGDLTDVLGKFMQRKRQETEREEESEALRDVGYNIPGAVRNTKIREALLDDQKRNKKFNTKDALMQKKVETISKHFGPEAAELYPHLTEGGQTKLFKSLLQGSVEGKDRKQTVIQHLLTNPQDIEPTIEEENAEEIRAEEEPFRVEQPRIKSPDKFNDIPEYELDIGDRTGKSLYDFQKELRADNEPIRKDSITSKRALDKSLRSLNDLEKLSSKLPSGLSRFLFDKEGNIRPLAQALQLVPPEAEEYVKIVNDFTTQAKDSYGARVTNFELDRFLKRLPTAINSQGGRELIIKRMKNIAEIDRVKEEALQDVYKKYGLGNITPEDAEYIAEQVAETRTDNLIEQGNQLEDQLEQFESEGKQRKSTNKRSLEEIFG